MANQIVIIVGICLPVPGIALWGNSSQPGGLFDPVTCTQSRFMNVFRAAELGQKAGRLWTDYESFRVTGTKVVLG